MKKICFIVLRYHPAVGGTERLCQEVLEEASKKYQVSIITSPEYFRNKNEYNYKIFDCNPENFHLMKEHFEIFNYDMCIFFSELFHPFLYEYNTSWAKKNICILNLDENIYQIRNNFKKSINNLKKFDKVVTYSKDGVANKFLSEYNIKNIYIPNFSRDILQTKLENNFKEKLKFYNNKTILYNGAFEERKNQYKIIEKISSSKKLKNYNWIFVGGISDESYYNKCINLSYKNKLQNLKFIKATSNTKIIDQLYQISDCVLLASTAEGMPLVLIEALSANKPIISTPVGAVPGVLGQFKEVSVLSSVDFSLNELENEIEKQLNNKVNNRKIWEDNFQKEDVCNKYLKLIEEII